MRHETRHIAIETVALVILNCILGMTVFYLVELKQDHVNHDR